MANLRDVLEVISVEEKQTSIVIPQEIQDEIDTVKQAQEELGAGALSRQASEWQQKKKGAELAEVLFNAGIHVHEPASVKKYQAKKVEEINQPIKQNAREIRRFMIWLAFIFFVILWGVIFNSVIFFSLNLASNTRWIIGTVSFFISFGIGFIMMLERIGDVGFDSDMWEWRQTELAGYSFVPTGTLKQALTIHNSLPSAKFYVEELVRQNKKADPFLRVDAGSKRYYIAVWDELGFKE